MGERRARRLAGRAPGATGRAARGAADRGATIIEYALVLSVLAGAAMAVLPALGARGSAAVGRQATCIATRPVPVACREAGPTSSAEP